MVLPIDVVVVGVLVVVALIVLAWVFVLWLRERRRLKEKYRKLSEEGEQNMEKSPLVN